MRLLFLILAAWTVSVVWLGAQPMTRSDADASQAGGQRSADRREGSIRQLLRRLKDHSLPERLDGISEHLLGRPYLSGPLGEGAGGRFDQAPLYRLDAFDCTTFVETVLALATAGNLEEFPGILNAIRYRDGDVRYQSRNHFVSLDWVPSNIAAGFLEDVTRQLAPEAGEVSEARTFIDKRQWYARKTASSLHLPGLDPAGLQARLHELRGLGESFEPGVASIPYISLDALLRSRGEAVRQRIAGGSIVNIVRPGWDLRDSIGTRLNVSHQGLVVRRGGELIFRHASSAPPKAVVDVDFVEYLRRCRDNPTIGGINVLVAREGGAVSKGGADPETGVSP